MNHPLAVLALLVLVANDHLFKAEFSNVITGKASDVAGLVLFPLVVTSLVDWVVWISSRRQLNLETILLPLLVATALGFTGLQLSPLVAETYDDLSTWLWRPSRTTQDPTDLLALPALLVALLVARQTNRQCKHQALRPAEHTDACVLSTMG